MSVRKRNWPEIKSAKKRLPVVKSANVSGNGWPPLKIESYHRLVAIVKFLLSMEGWKSRTVIDRLSDCCLVQRSELGLWLRQDHPVASLIMTVAVPQTRREAAIVFRAIGHLIVHLWTEDSLIIMIAAVAREKEST